MLRLILASSDFDADQIESACVDGDFEFGALNGGGGFEKSIDAKSTADGCVANPWKGGSRFGDSSRALFPILLTLEVNDESGSLDDDVLGGRPSFGLSASTAVSLR